MPITNYKSRITEFEHATALQGAFALRMARNIACQDNAGKALSCYQ